MKNRRQALQSCSLTTYTLIVYLVALTIILISFSFFWSSDARQLAVEIQRATDEQAPSPFLEERPDLLLLNNGILEPEEWQQIRLQLQELLLPLEAESDFRLEGEAAIERLLSEF